MSILESRSLDRAMSLQKSIDLPREKKTDLLEPLTPNGGDSPVAVMQRDGAKPERWGCPSCRYYDSECICCTYIYTPIAILFACPQTLDDRS
jgi:hypothetical protein